MAEISLGRCTGPVAKLSSAPSVPTSLLAARALPRGLRLVTAVPTSSLSQREHVLIYLLIPGRTAGSCPDSWVGIALQLVPMAAFSSRYAPG